MSVTSLAVKMPDGGVYDPTASPGMWAHWITQDHREPWTFPRHLQLLDQKLVDVATGKIKRLMIFMPPRHGKSELCSKYFPAWYLGTFPDRRIIICGYGNKFAEEWGRKSRDIMEEYGKPYFGQIVNPRSSAADHWNIHRRNGGLIAAGVCGGITGRGADCLLIDDPFKGHKDAQSEANRLSVWNWYVSEAYSRLSPEGAIVLINTRWNRDDLSGRLLQQQADSIDEFSDDPWEVVSLPALCEEPNDVLGREIGDALWPERWTAERLHKRKSRSTPYWWNALYQQRPTQHDTAEWPDSYFHDGIWFTDWPTDAQTQFRVMALDPSLGRGAAKAKGDYSAIIMLALDLKGRLYVDADMDRRSAVQIVEDSSRLARGFRPDSFGVESNNFQSLLHTLFDHRAEIDGFRLPMCSIYSSSAIKKEDKIRKLGPRLMQTEILFRRDSKGARMLVNQLREFPLAAYDDGPDALAMAVELAYDIWSGATDIAASRDGLDSRYDSVMAPAFRR